MTNETQNDEGRKISLLKIIGKAGIGYLAFEGATRIAEANLPREYAELVRNLRESGEILASCVGVSVLAASPFWGLALHLNKYRSKG